METLLISPNYEVVIPLAMRQSLGILPGQQVQVIQYDNRIELIPLRPMRAARGLLKGIDTSVERDGDRDRV